jgi:hypothetical protein
MYMSTNINKRARNRPPPKHYNVHPRLSFASTTRHADIVLDMKPIRNMHLFRAGDLEWLHIPLQIETNGDVDGLVGAAEGVGVVLEVLAVVGDLLARELEGNEAVLLAVWLLGESGEDGALGDVGVHGEVVEAGAEDHVVHVGGADVLALEVRSERGVALDGVSPVAR